MRPHARYAYTLIEVLVVVVLLSIVAGIVVPQMLRAGTLGVQAAARMVVADILHAQNDAVAHQRPRRVVFNVAENRYRLTDATGETLPAPWRSGEAHQVDLKADRRFANVRLVEADFNGQGTLEFDEMGSPASGGEVVLEYEQRRYSILVAPFTGRVSVKAESP